MVDFRKALLIVALLVSISGLASAQTSLQCTANSSSVPLVRYEGIAEEMGQVFIDCIGGTPTANGVAIPRVNIVIFLGTNVTSRLLNTTTLGSEAMLVVDDPPVGSRYLCQAPGNCGTFLGTGSGSGVYTGADVNHANIFQAIQSAPNQLSWLGVPFDPPGTNPRRRLRIVNVRGNANGAGLSGGLIPNDIKMFITISGTGAPPLFNPLVSVASVVESYKFTATKNTSLNQCEVTTATVDVTFAELFAHAFRSRGTADQNDILTIYNTESMFSDTTITNGVANAGYATQGTRHWIKLSNVPTGVAIAARDRNSNWGGNLMASRVTGFDSVAAGGTVTVAPTGSYTTVLTETATTREVTLVYEVVGHDAGVTQEFKYDLQISYDQSPLPGLGTASVQGNYAPVSDVFTASNTLSAPRFVFAPKSGGDVLTINPCQTNLLFPFVAQTGNFDTGIAISNTSKDPFSTPNQTGKCNMYYYGTNEPATNPDDTSVDIAAGKQLLYTLSAGNAAQGLNPAPGFVGYIIARCNFQYAHGYAFISDLGSKEFAQGYIALVMDEGIGTRTGASSENLNQ